MVDDPVSYISFLKDAFEAKEHSRTMDESGEVVRNCILQIGETCFMIGQAREIPAMHTSFYLYTSDVDALHQRVLDQGAEEVFAPAQMDYGDYQSGVKDIAGNYWWISCRLVEATYGNE